MYKPVWVVVEVTADGEIEVLMVHWELELAKLQVMHLEETIPEGNFRIERSSILAL